MRVKSIFIFINVVNSYKLFNANFGKVFLKTIPTSRACDVIKGLQVDAIRYDVVEKEDEFRNAKIWCKYHMYDEKFSVGVVFTFSTLDYFVLYRQHDQVFTVENLLRVNPVSMVTAEDVFDMLRSECKTMGYIQLPRAGRYKMEVTIEHMYENSIKS